MKTKITVVVISAICMLASITFAQPNSDCTTMTGAAFTATGGTPLSACASAQNASAGSVAGVIPAGCTLKGSCTYSADAATGPDADGFYTCVRRETCNMKCPKSDASKSCYFGGSASILCPCGQKPFKTAGCPNPAFICVPGPRLEDPEIDLSYSSFGIYKVFPNPSNGHILVEYIGHSDNNSAVEFSIYDITGRIVFQVEEIVANGGNTFDIQLPDLTSGIYLLKSKEGNESSQMKLMINK